MAKTRRKYTKEFKIETVRLMVDQGRTARSVAKDLGLNEAMLYQWKSQLLKDGDLAFPGNGKAAISEIEAENRRLRKELADVKQDREILKKAAAYFAKNQG